MFGQCQVIGGVVGHADTGRGLEAFAKKTEGVVVRGETGGATDTRHALGPQELLRCLKQGLRHRGVVDALKPSEKADLVLPKRIKVVVHAGGNAAHQRLLVLEGHEQLGPAVLVVGVLVGM